MALGWSGVLAGEAGAGRGELEGMWGGGGAAGGGGEFKEVVVFFVVLWD